MPARNASIDGVPPVGARRQPTHRRREHLTRQRGQGNMANVDRCNGNACCAGEWRELVRLVLDSFVAGLVVSLVLALAVFIVTSPAQAAPRGRPDPACCISRSDRRRAAPSPLRVHRRAHGRHRHDRARLGPAAVREPDAEWREGVYVFPLPEQAAVDHLHLEVGERVIDGPDQGARRGARAPTTPRRARGARPRWSSRSARTSSPPASPTSARRGGTVAIEYQETVRYDDGTFRLRFPLAITPRYIPGAPVASAGDRSAGRRPRSRCTTPTASRRRWPRAARAT